MRNRTRFKTLTFDSDLRGLRVLGIPYHPYFDEKQVVESQNDITFY